MSETDVAVMEVPEAEASGEATPRTKPARKPRGPKKPRSGDAAASDEAAGHDAESEAAGDGGTAEEALELAPLVEAILITMDKAIPVAQVAQALGVDGPGGKGRVLRAVEVLNEQYGASGRAFRVESVAGGLRLMTRPEFAGVIAAIHGVRESQRLTKAGIETLAIVAYRQPITRAEVEAIRGVACGDVLRTLLERRMVAIVGRAEELGRPMLYGTSKRFLEIFGLASIKDLPAVSEVFPGIEMPAAKKRTVTPVEPGEGDGEASS